MEEKNDAKEGKESSKLIRSNSYVKSERPTTARALQEVSNGSKENEDEFEPPHPIGTENYYKPNFKV